ncbi:hypothetical protein PverR02_03720 [Pseudomonas veronii]|nr:hypothetical protein PverR02_03720 [Pseudomonas veronii]
MDMFLSDDEVLGIVVSHLTKLRKNRREKEVRFPLDRKLRSGPEEHFNIIIEQARKLIDGRTNERLCGLQFWDGDEKGLKRLFANDLQQFLAAENIFIPEISLVHAQTLIPDKAAFNIARSRLLPVTYKSIELANHASAFDYFSVPFLIRLSIENKLKKIIGFVKSDVARPGRASRLDTQEFPVTSLILELKKLGCLDLPCDFEDLLQIYNWSCRFCHTGQKEYLWLSMKAIEILSPLFSSEKHLECEIKIQSLWGYGVLKSQVLLNKTYTHVGPCQPLYYFGKGWGIHKLQQVLNTTDTASLKAYTFYLSESALGERSGFYCQKNKVHI